MVFVLIAITVFGIAWAIGSTLLTWFAAVWFRFFRYHRKKSLPLPDGPRWSDRIGHWLREAWALVMLHVWRLERGPSRMSPTDAPGHPVLCVHGFTQDRTNFSALRRRLWQQGRPTVSVDLGLPGGHPRRLAPKVIAELKRIIEEHPGEPIDIVCHSMGGLVLRDALGRVPELVHPIRSIVTLGSPHRGTAGARWPVRLWPEARGLARKSAWIEELPTFTESVPDARAVTIGGSADYVVYPLSTCHLPDSEAVDFHGIGHVGLLRDKDVLDTVIAAFEGEPLPRRQGSEISPAGPRTLPA